MRSWPNKKRAQKPFVFIFFRLFVFLLKNKNQKKKKKRNPFRMDSKKKPMLMPKVLVQGVFFLRVCVSYRCLRMFYRYPTARNKS
ncbi:Uncharacterized protein APZ42_002524 [Daphnia magna]|uniref:Uncharacterized protein n=1 Tax=Daphnia magna TaxID=35525 RepID=A0A164I7M3_9CRUS|nr:Uncharacterized protein APZ42_002524 [Daphnia magna]